MIAVCLAALLAAGEAGQSPVRPGYGETVAEIRIHGNHISTDEEVVRLAGVAVGAPFTATTLDDVRARLRASGRFRSVEVLKRFASIEDPSRIALVIVVNEGPVRIEVPDEPGEPPRVVRRRGLRNLMLMPILDAEDGYGVTFGVRVARPGVLGRTSRLSAPLTWGGTKQAGLELDRRFGRGPFSRVEVGTAVQRQRNPAFDVNDDRRRAWARVERAVGPLRAGGTAGWQRVRFDGGRDDIRSVEADVAFDTRLDPALPRDAVFAAASWERLAFRAGGTIDRTRLDGRAYIGLVGQPVLVLRAVREDASAPLPRYLRSLLGGWSSVRGFRAGASHGDTLVSGSVEVRIPLNSPLDVAKLGVSVFVDAGAAYDKGERLGDQRARLGSGGSVWITVAAFRMSLALAHGRGSGTRVNFGAGLTF